MSGLPPDITDDNGRWKFALCCENVDRLIERYGLAEVLTAIGYRIEAAAPSHVGRLTGYALVAYGDELEVAARRASTGPVPEL